jgi:DNA polymerase-3 subunit epsilon
MMLKPHSLGATFKRYYGYDFEGAHEAGADVKATGLVLAAQLEAFPDIVPKSLKALSELSIGNTVDISGKLKIDQHGDIVFNSGKKIDQPVWKNRGFVEWMDGKNFPKDTMRIAWECIASKGNTGQVMRSLRNE